MIKSSLSQNKINYFKDNKKLRVFLLFLFLSIVFWALIKLSKNYITDVSFKVNYTDLPVKKLLQNSPPEQIEVTLNTTGFKLLGYAFKNTTINYSLTELRPRQGTIHYSVTRENEKLVQAQLPAEVEVLKLKPDTLYFDLGNKKFKKVPIKSNIELNFKLGYNLIEAFKVEPDYVQASGPEKYVDSIEFVDSEALVLNNIHESFERKVQLIEPNQHITFNTGEIMVSGTVAKITEGTFNLPVKVVNLPKNYILTTYPKELKVIYQVALKDYNKISKNSFEVVCDFEETEQNNLDYLIPKIIKKPDLLFDVKVLPGKIEYLVKK